VAFSVMIMKIRVTHQWWFVALFSVVILVTCAQPIYHAWVYHRTIELYKTAPTSGTTLPTLSTDLHEIDMELWRLHPPLLATGYVVPYRIVVTRDLETCHSMIVDLNREGRIRVASLWIQSIWPPNPNGTRLSASIEDFDQWRWRSSSVVTA